MQKQPSDRPLSHAQSSHAHAEALLDAPLDVARARAARARHAIGHTLDYAASMLSTMLPAHAAAQTLGARAHGYVVATEQQQAGRGRRNRTWHAPARRALLTSIALASPQVMAWLAWLPQLAGVAALDALEHVAPQLAPRLGLKWPNDLVILPSAGQSTTLAKLGGILMEGVSHAVPDQSSHAGSNRPQTYMIMGFGINANQSRTELPPIEAPALPPTSLYLAGGHPIDRTELLIALCQSLTQRLASLPSHCPEDPLSDPGAQAVHHAWRSRLTLMHEPIHVYPHTGDPYPAVAHTVTPRGELVVTDRRGKTHTLVAEEVSIRPRTEPD